MRIRTFENVGWSPQNLKIKIQIWWGHTCNFKPWTLNPKPKLKWWAIKENKHTIRIETFKNGGGGVDHLKTPK